jgi:hypothetical protein
MTTENKPESPSGKSIIDFLLGSGSYDGYWWHDIPKDKRPPFWWRTKLREEIAAKEEEVTHWKGGYQAANDTIKLLEEENAKLREALKELLPIAESFEYKGTNQYQLKIDRAKSLLNND